MYDAIGFKTQAEAYIAPDLAEIAPSWDRISHNMIAVSGGTFHMGSERHYPEEAPVHQVHVDAFLIDRYPVANADFARFVVATGYVTTAEIAPDPKDYPGALPHMLKPGSLVFCQPSKRVSTADWAEYWEFIFGASWRMPTGPGSDIQTIQNHPVVQVSYTDALAYAQWAGKDLPTEAEWEYAARGGLNDAEFAWGDELVPNGQHMANTWQGQFPWQNTDDDGWRSTSPVGSYPPNGYGLHDMIGNVWEWTSDFWTERHPADAAKPCCIPRNPRSLSPEGSHDPCQPEILIPRKVLKGGSHLCAPNYCQRYRPAARHPEPIDTSTNHVGFRCVLRKEIPGN